MTKIFLRKTLQDVRDPRSPELAKFWDRLGVVAITIMAIIAGAYIHFFG